METIVSRKEPQAARLPAPRREPLDPNEAGMAFGAVLAVWHAAWAGLVALGAAQKMLDWALWLHFLSNPYEVEPFSGARALALVGVAFVAGYALGAVFAWALNAARGA